jgi:hypothetical protein
VVERRLKRVVTGIGDRSLQLDAAEFLTELGACSL